MLAPQDVRYFDAGSQHSGLQLNIAEARLEMLFTHLQRLAGIFVTDWLFEQAIVTTFEKIKSSTINPVNRIEMPSNQARTFHLDENELVTVVNPLNAESLECYVALNDDIAANSVSASRFVADTLHLPSTSTVVILTFRKLHCAETIVQLIDNLKEGIIILSEEDHRLISPDFVLYQLNHLFSGATYIISTDKILSSRELKPGQIRLSYFQRQILNLYPPAVIPETLLHRLVSFNQLSGESKDYLLDTYRDEKRITLSDFHQSTKVYKTLCRANYEELQIVPVVESYKAKHLYFQETAYLVSDLIVGNREMLLKCGRPYPSDEDKDVVRISRDNLSLLGIEESDRVVIRFKNRHAVARVICIDSFDQISETNLLQKETSINLMVGIPAHLRKALGVYQLDTGVIVERHAWHLFKKKAYMQCVPILALAFTVFQTFPKNVTLAILIFLFSLPIVIYTVLSEVRNKVK